MTTRQKKWIAATVATIAFAGCVMVFTRPREPRYEGRSLTYWAARLDQAEAQRALTVIGTNALPYLIEWLDEEPTRFDRWLRWVAMRLPNSFQSSLSLFESRRLNAARALGYLGTDAATAIPHLNRLPLEGWPRGMLPANLIALAEIGTESIPVLLAQVHDDSSRAHYIADALVHMAEPYWKHPRDKMDLQKIVTALEHLSSNPDQNIRLAATSRLLLLDQQEIHEEVVRVWAKLLRDESEEVRAAAVEAADYLFREDPDANVREAVERALQRAGRLGPIPEPVALPPKP